MSGYRVRITESAGTALSKLLPSTNTWGPQDCESLDCLTYHQGDKKRINCRQGNIPYESVCIICEEVKKPGQDGKSDSMQDGRGLYVGESSRCIYERAKKHEAEKNKHAEESHQVKHWLTSHEELLAPPKFKFKIVRTFQDPLTRQLSEAVRIELRRMKYLTPKLSILGVGYRG